MKYTTISKACNLIKKNTHITNKGKEHDRYAYTIHKKSSDTAPYGN